MLSSPHVCPRCKTEPVVRRVNRGALPICSTCKDERRRDLLEEQRVKRASGEWDSHTDRRTGSRYTKAELHTAPCVHCNASVLVKRRTKYNVVCDECVPAHAEAIYQRKKQRIMDAYAADPERYLRRRIQIRLERGGLTMDWYDVRVGRCGVCGTTEPSGKGWHIDHDHSCCNDDKLLPFGCAKCIRGIVCHSCNIGMGNFKDDPVRMRAAAQWIEDHPVRP